MLLMTLVMFLVLAAYYMLKTAREVFILTEGGAEVKSYSSAGQAVLLLFLVPGVRRRRVAGQPHAAGAWVTLFFGRTSRCSRWRQAGLHIGIVYFLWVGIFNVMVIAQFWALAADLFTPDQGKRLFPLIGVGSSLGAWVGSVRAGQVMEAVGASALLIGAAVGLRRRDPRAVIAQPGQARRAAEAPATRRWTKEGLR